MAFSKPKTMVVLGDSFLSWWPVEHCLNVDLNKYASNMGIGYYNLSYGGFGPIEYLDQMKRISPLLDEGDIVLLFYYVGNDLTDTQYRTDKAPKRPDELKLTVAAPAPLGPYVKIEPAKVDIEKENSGFDWKAMELNGIDKTLIQYAQNRIKVTNVVGPQYVNPHLLTLAMSHPRYIMDNILMGSKENKKTWLEVEIMLDEINRIAEAKNVHLYIVVIPSTVQVSNSHYDFYRICPHIKRLGTRDRTYPRRYP